MVLPLSRLRRCRGVSAICAITLCLFLVNAVIFLGSLSELGSHESRFPRAVFSSAATRNQALVDSSIVKITQRLEKLENAVSRLQHSVASKIDNKKKDHHKACPIPSSWRYPFCARKVEWIQHLWTTNSQCYVDQHGIDPADECTILQFLSEEGDPLKFKEMRYSTNRDALNFEGRRLPHGRLNKAQTRTDLDGFLGILREDKFQWMRERATRLWPLWVQGIRSLEKRDHKLNNRKQKNILIMMGSFIMEPMFFYFAYRGGPLGEMVQWTDLIASLYILGHNITLCSNKTDVTRYILIMMGSFIMEPMFFYFAYRGGPLGEMVQWTDLIASLYILGHNITLCSNKTDVTRYVRNWPTSFL
ncbi:predicted protein [Nematostella vectensis]|uniref:alpha-1,6-mannosyl-glycoprotein 6-beta-N-acetylglucosaminyltransferase n=1 Tax=Nematostella vectensis TaxID=45351 RepID=A7RRT3_NEMVE|nr:predicted protein [Nematostella vectensis]|eukprot:XP_001637881.1 predicted protein [Nematostella vectensis]